MEAGDEADMTAEYKEAGDDGLVEEATRNEFTDDWLTGRGAGKEANMAGKERN